MLGSNSMNWKWELDNNTFDLVNVSQFKNTHFSTILALLLAIGQTGLTTLLYALDCYTCVRLLAYNSWGSEIQPYIPFSILRWIFSGCILLLIVLLIYEFIYGLKIYFTRNISLTYTNEIARGLWSIKGYLYFCLYDQITPKNFFDYCAFFIYFTLKGCIKLLFADLPRQVINGLTIYSVVKDNSNQVVTSFQQLTHDGVKETWAIVFTIMGLSFIIWLFFIIKFAIALIMCLCVVSRISSEGYNLKQFVCIRINERVRELLSKYHKESLKHLKEENSRLGLQPTLPHLPDNINSDGYLFNGRKSLRKSGNDLLPLNKNPPPPLPVLSNKTSQNSLRNPPQEAMLPIYGAFHPRPYRTLTDYGSRNGTLASSTDNLLGESMLPKREMPKPHPLEDFTPMLSHLTGFTTAAHPYTPQSRQNTGFSTQATGGFEMPNTHRSGSSGSQGTPYSGFIGHRGSPRAGHPLPELPDSTGNPFASPETGRSYLPAHHPHTFTPVQEETSAFNSPIFPQNPYFANTQTGGLMESSAPYNTVAATVGTGTLPQLHEQQPASTAYNMNLPYPSATQPVPRVGVPATRVDLPAPRIDLPNPRVESPRLNTNLRAPERKEAVVSPNSRLLLIHNLYGGEADNGDSGVSPVLQTYKDMGMEDYMVKKR